MSDINRDVRRFKKIGQDSRMDLKEFIKRGNLGDKIRVPIKIVDLPEFEYDKRHVGGVGQGEGEVGDPVDADNGDEQGEPGEDPGEHGYYEMDPEEFARELDDELGLDFEEKGQKVVETADGDFNETRRAGPNSTLDTDYLFKQAIKRHVAMFADTEYVKELLRTRGYGVQKVWNWSQDNMINISRSQIEDLADKIDNPTKYDSEDEIDRELRRSPPRSSYSDMKFRSDDERYRAPEIVTEPQHNAVVINIRDVSGSMRKKKRELVERVFTPLDWYLQGKYENVEFVYVAHDAQAWQVDRDEFFGIRSGGGTQVSSAFELIQDEILQEYPWESWNRFIFAAGDGENQRKDTESRVIPKLKEIESNKTAYVEVQPNGQNRTARVAEKLEKEFSDMGSYRIERVAENSDVISAIKNILRKNKQVIKNE